MIKRHVSILVLAVLAAACSKSEAPSAASPAQANPPVTEAAAPAPAAAPAAPSQDSDHHYAMEEGGEYGYEVALSNNERDAGQAAAALVMVRYLGEKEGVHTVTTTEDGILNSYSCKAPCEFIKVKASQGGEVLSTETMRNTEGALVSLVMSDAMSGRLKPYKTK